MNAADRHSECRRWLNYAQEDLRAARAMLGQTAVSPRHVCFLAQQAAEKALKAVLVLDQIDFPRTHDLDALRNLIPAPNRTEARWPNLAALTEWAVEARYPGDWPAAQPADARAAVDAAAAILHEVLAILINAGWKPD